MNDPADLSSLSIMQDTADHIMQSNLNNPLFFYGTSPSLKRLSVDRVSIFDSCYSCMATQASSVVPTAVEIIWCG